MAILRCPLALAVVLALSLAVHAQTLELSLGTGGAETGGSLALAGMREGPLTADLRLGVSTPEPHAWHALFRTRISRSATLGLLGAATLELDAAVRTDGEGMALLAGQGVLGPVSARLGVRAASADPETFALTGLAPLDTAPRVPGTRFGVDLRARYRIERDLLLDMEPSAVLAPVGWGLRLRGALRVRRMLTDVDGVVAWHAWRAPGDGSWSAAVGAGAVWAPRRAPEWHGTVWLGWSRGGLAPGAEVRGSASLGGSWTVAVALAAEPFRMDVPSYRGSVEATADLGGYAVFVATEAQAPSSGGSGLAAAARVGVRVALR